MISWCLRAGIYRLVALRGVGGLGGNSVCAGSASVCGLEMGIEISADISRFMISS